MGPNIRIVGALVIVLVAVLSAYYFFVLSTNNGIQSATIVKEDSIKGCYVASTERSLYTLKISSIDGNLVSGAIAYNNFGKGISNGIFTGTYEDSVLVANYSYASKGKSAVKQLIFKKVENDLIQGYDSSLEEESNFEELDSTLTSDFNPNPRFIKLSSCDE